jgi:hypothetical protein
MSKLRALCTSFGLVIFALVIVLGLLEALLAITKLNVPDFSLFIPGKGTTYIPHAYYRHTKEGFSEGRFNSHGFRDYERTYEKPPGVFRILVLGDSYIEAFQVQLEESFTAQLEKLLNAQSSSAKYEVLSLGQSGFGTAEEYLRYLNFGAAYSPDLVVLALTTGNDFRNNSKLLNGHNGGFYYAFDQDRNLVLDRSLVDAYESSQTYPRRLFQSLKSHSHLLTLVSERVYLLNRQLQEAHMSQVHAAKPSMDSGTSALGLFSDLNIYRINMPPEWKEAVEITKAIILEFQRSVEERGSKFLLMSLSNAEQVHKDLGDELKARYNVNLDYEQPDRILEQFAATNKIMFLKLMPALRDHYRKTTEYVHGFGSSRGGHWNQTGHRIAAQVTFQFLEDQHLVPSRGG